MFKKLCSLLLVLCLITNIISGLTVYASNDDGNISIQGEKITEILKLEKSEAKLGDVVTFEVYSQDSINANKTFEIYFLDEDGKTFTSNKLWSPELNEYYSDTVYAYGTLDENGRSETEFKIPTDINVGEYRFKVYFYGTDNTVPTDLKLTVSGVNKSLLEDAISAACLNKASAVVSADGSEVEMDQKWVTQEVMDKYEGTIKAVKGILNKAGAEQAEVNQAITDLDTATGEFNNAKRYGTKQAAYTVTFSAGENGSLTASVDGTLISVGSIVAKGKDIVFNALPAENYRIKEWRVNGVVESGIRTDSITISNIKEPKAVTVTFKRILKSVAFPVDRKVIAEALDKAANVLIEKFDDSNFNYQKHWMAVGINGAGKKVPASYLNEIKKGDMPSDNSGQYGKYILGILAAGGDPENINGRNLLAELCQLSDMKNVGTEGGIYSTPFGLLALDAVNYEIPKGAGFTRDDLINKLITFASPTGGEDGIGFVLTALGKYYNEKPAVKEAVDKVVAAWAASQGDDGGFGAGAWSDENNVNTAAQILMGLSFNGKNPQSEQFTKKKGNIVSFILSLQNEDDSFNWQKNEDGSISMATEQAVYALCQYLRQLDGKNSIYDFTDRTPENQDITAPVIYTDLADKSVNSSILTFKASAIDAVEGPVVPVVKVSGSVLKGINGSYKVNLSEGSNIITVSTADSSGNKEEKSFTISYTAKTQLIPSGDKPRVEIPDDNNDYKLPLVGEDSNKEITIEIPDGNDSKVLVGLPLNSSLPEIKAIKGNVTALLPKGIRVTNGNASQIELITSKDAGDSEIKNKVDDIIPAGKKLDSIVQAFSMGGGESVEFDGYVTLTFKGMQGKEAVYIQNGILHLIQKYASDSAGLAGGRKEYAFDSGNDLIVKTKHFTEFVAYSASIASANDNGGGTTPQVKKYVTLSVDKLTINEGYTVSTLQLELQSGDTAWSILKRELDSRGINYKYIWSEQYGSVYMQSIDGDGEFDHGSGSGWMYNVNGWYPNYGATKYTLKDGDKLQWRYTTNLGADLGEDLSKWNEQTKQDETGNQSAVDSTLEESKESKKDYTENIDLKKIYKDEGDISSWAYEAIRAATQKGFVGGNSDEFGPKESITKAEFIKIMVSVLELDIKTGKAINFIDVKENDWFYPYVNAAYKAGIVKGNDNRFNPEEKITREQIAAIIIRTLGVKPVKPVTAIQDLHAVSYCFITDVETIFAIGLMVGDGRRFYPENFATKEMAVVVALKAYDFRTGRYDKNLEIKKYIEETGALMQKTVLEPVVSSIGGEWTVLSLARSGINVPDSYYAKYYSNVRKKLKDTSGKLHRVKYTEYDRVILALGSIGKDITNVDGYDLTWPLADFNTVIKQGLNGPVWALIALDSKGYKIPADKNVVVQTTREMMVDYILSKEIKGGGWSLTSEAPADTDITAMALQALSKYRKNEKVSAAIERALSYLSDIQQKDGSFNSVWGEDACSESISQVIVALTSLGIDPKTDKRFIKNGNDTITALLAFYVEGGGFKHTLEGELDAMATDQGMYALVAYDRFVSRQKPLYDMTDVKNNLRW